MEISVKDLRKKLGYTQQKLADELCVTLQTIQNWESGRKIPDSKKKLLLLYNSNNSGIIGVGNNNNKIDNRHFYSDSPDVLKHQVETLERVLGEKEQRIKEKDAQIKEKDAQIKEKDAQIKEKDAQIKDLLEILKRK